MDRVLEFDRDYRRQVRRAYYLLPEDFASAREYNDYLEEFEDLVEEFIKEETRPMARQKLDRLRIQWATQTARNLATYDGARMQRADAIEHDRLAQARAAQERRLAEAEEQRLKVEKRNALQQGISAGKTSVEQARADLRAHAAALAGDAAARAAAGVPPTASGAAAQHEQQQQQQQRRGEASGTYVPAAPAGSARGASGAPMLVQPLDPAAAKAVEARVPSLMVRSLMTPDCQSGGSESTFLDGTLPDDP
jgi:hypothetical protein